MNKNFARILTVTILYVNKNLRILYMVKKTLLIITDGIGHKPNSSHNAFCNANKPTYDSLFASVPHSLISTHGLSVGLPEGQMGNSEVGHMCLGSGRILYQDLVRISRALDDGSLAKNDVLLDFVKDKNRIHIAGLLSDGGVHSHIDHIVGLTKLIQHLGIDVSLHLITDGRDVSPSSASLFLKQIEGIVSEKITIATIGGRYYAMDRDKRWDRVEQAWRAMALGESRSKLSPLEYIKSQYEDGNTDEFIQPVSFESHAGIKPGDGFIFANFRSDRAREIVNSIGTREFLAFDRGGFIPPSVLCMTPYDDSFDFPILFPKEKVEPTLAQIISKAGLRQLHVAETEKYAHVTFFFNGGVETPWDNESRVLIKSPDVATYDLKPEMSAREVGEATMEGIRDGFDFIVVNFANGDMVGHTGNINAAIKAVEAVDSELGRILALAKERGYAVVLTSDHGNCEEMRDEAGNMLTNHTVGDVWCFVSDERVTEISSGGLSNIAPSVLKLMGLEIPKEMDRALF